MCGESEKDIKHVLEKYKYTGEKEKKWWIQIKEGKKTITRLKKIKRIREQKEKEEKINRENKETECETK